jgi:type I restriction enzyme R subunit
MKKVHEEVFEDEVVAHLLANGWLEGVSKHYDRELALYPEDVLGWLEDTQPEELTKIKRTHNGDTAATILKVLAENLKQHDTLEVLRHGFKHVGTRLKMCEFKPNTGFNPTTARQYAAVRCRVVRQLRYSRHNDNEIDLVLFVNGLPIATLELKTEFTQTVSDAMQQYRRDRLPRDPKTKINEPLLQFKQRALVHFAVSTEEVWMTTRLDGKDTRFLPFNRGNDGAAGNPPNPNGYRTSYLWEEVLQRDSLLLILGRFMQIENPKKTRPDTKETLIFPRYHQLQAVNLLVETARQEGAGHTYLVQHSAGSGKSNSLAWLAHRLSSLYNTANEKVFDSVIVVTDRTLLDQQLGETIYQFEHKTGVVVQITGERASKSSALGIALLERVPIIIVTLQTFPFVLDHLQDDASLAQHRFAVLADEAHSSHTSDTSNDMTRVLGKTSDPEADIEDMLLQAMEQRANHRNISYFAFTATPKARTLLRFGRRPRPNETESINNKPGAFHTYTMQQAIEEGYILDVLHNYLAYRVAYKLSLQGKEYSQTEIEENRAWKQLMEWVQIHPVNIGRTVSIIIEHFRANVQPMLNGKAKAMVVTASRKEAVRFKLAIDKYIRDNQYNLATLVAFSGDVQDSESGPNPFNERTMNPNLRGSDIREAFAEDYQVLIVANKFQTGFDQPLLCAMYVHKRLDGITAVQTLSRLNRTYPDKTDTYVLDFVNNPDDILAAFKPYYREATLADVSDPNTIHTLQSKLDATRIYTADEVDNFVAELVNPRGSQARLQAIIGPPAQRFRNRWREAIAEDDRQERDALELFRKDALTFVRHYSFLSQIFNYADTELEKRSRFLSQLIPLIRGERFSDPVDTSGVTMTHYKSSAQGVRDLKLRDGATPYELSSPNALGSGVVHDPAKTTLDAMIAALNTLFEGDLSETDLIGYLNHIRDKMLAHPGLAQQAQHNSKAQFALGDFRNVMHESIVSAFDSYNDMTKQLLSNEGVRNGFAALILDVVYNAFAQAKT